MRSPALLLPLMLTIAAMGTGSCARQTREDMRQERLDSFRAVLPAEIRESFDAIGEEADCASVGAALSEARTDDPTLDAAVDSVMHAELIDTFTNEEVIYFFWFYFDNAIETGTVRGP